MIYSPSSLAVGVFAFFVLVVLGISFYLGAKAKSASGYYAAHGQIPGSSTASRSPATTSRRRVSRHLRDDRLLRLRRLPVLHRLSGRLDRRAVRHRRAAQADGEFTFADALDSKFHSRGIKLSAAISTLVVSIFYLIPQMVGAGALIKPLLGPRILSRCDSGRRHRDPDCRHGRHGEHDLGAVHQGGAAGAVLHHPDGDDLDAWAERG